MLPRLLRTPCSYRSPRCAPSFRLLECVPASPMHAQQLAGLRRMKHSLAVPLQVGTWHRPRCWVVMQGARPSIAAVSAFARHIKLPRLARQAIVAGRAALFYISSATACRAHELSWEVAPHEVSVDDEQHAQVLGCAE